MDETPANNQVILNERVRASFDPNDKQELHDGKLYKVNYDAGDYLYYRIRFQNTGTDTAFEIQLRDTLTARLDAASVEFITSSHSCRFFIHNGNILVWKFANIMLPSKQENEPASNGYVYFRVKAAKGLTIGDSILNRAAIYFDYNLPVITNTQHTLISVNKAVITGLNDLFNRGYTSILRLYPNPGNKEVFILSTAQLAFKATAAIFDLSGKKLAAFGEKTLIPGIAVPYTLPLLKKGVYIIRLYGKTINESKLIVVE
jgi:uncharacterized repeat protein (TIGR01451 family)